MLNYLRQWFDRNFSDPRTITLSLILVGATALVLVMARLLEPVLASIVLAYLLEGLGERLERRGVGRLPAVLVVFAVFMVVFLFTLVAVLPLLSRQVVELVRDLPAMVAMATDQLRHLPDTYPTMFSRSQVDGWIGALGTEAARWGQRVLQSSLGYLPSLITAVVYLVLVPLLVFFFLKDKAMLLDWLRAYLPRERSLAKQVWAEVDQQLGNYIRGKVVEIAIVGAASYILFLVLGLNYAPLLAALVGLSVLIPYVGATVVTFPVVIIAFYQWGWGADLWTTVVAYLILQALDANVLVPLLFSEVVNLHPVAIIVAVLFFGGLWGVWGVFFAIPLATVVKAVLTAWPRGGPASAPPGADVGAPPTAASNA